MSQAPKLQRFNYETESYDAPFSSMMYDGLTDAFSGQAISNGAISSANIPSACA
jgi:hypothetical protein